MRTESLLLLVVLGRLGSGVIRSRENKYSFKHLFMLIFFCMNAE